MHFRNLLLVLMFVTAASAQPASLLGQVMLRPAFGKAAGEALAYAGIDVLEEEHLQVVRHGRVDEAKAWSDLWTGAYVVDGVAWVAGEALTRRALVAVGAGFGGPLGALATNFGAELLSNGLTAAYRGKPLAIKELVERSAVSAVGGAIGAALIPIPVVGWAVGTIAADVAYEVAAVRRERAQEITTSKVPEWYAGDAPPLGSYRPPTIRGQRLL